MWAYGNRCSRRSPRRSSSKARAPPSLAASTRASGRGIGGTRQKRCTCERAIFGGRGGHRRVGNKRQLLARGGMTCAYTAREGALSSRAHAALGNIRQAPIRHRYVVLRARFLFSGRWWQAAGAGGPRWEGSGERALAAGAHPSLFLSTWRKATRQSSIESLFSRRSCRTRDWTFTSCRSSHTRLKFCAGQGSRTQAVSFACRSHWGSAGAPLGFQSIWLGRAGTLPTVESGIARKKRPPIMQSTQKSCPTKRSQSQATVHQSHRRAKSLEGYRKGAWGLIDGGASEVPSTNHSGPVRPR